VIILPRSVDVNNCDVECANDGIMSLFARWMLMILINQSYFPYESSVFHDSLGNSWSIREIHYLDRPETESRPYDSWTRSVLFPSSRGSGRRP
jgi:hypothetical protein